MFKLIRLSALGVLVLSAASCKKDPVETVAYDGTLYDFQYNSTVLPAPNLPEDYTITAEMVSLGRLLFYETALSKDGTMNCASCHVQSDGFSDKNQFSTGVEGLEGGRQAMAIFNMAWNSNGFFWDGRAELLRHQAVLPIQDPLEMNETLANVYTKLSADQGYRDRFVRAFGSEDINEERIAKALESFMFSIVSDNSKYDRYLMGAETLTASEERGRQLFFAEYNEFFPDESGADCAHCHSGNNFENDQYMNNGLDTDALFTDLGREDVTNDPADRAKFKVTSLRNIAVTAPYMHDGRFNTLEEVVAHYNDGLQSSSTIDPALQATIGTGLMLTPTDIADLVNFLHTLTDDTYLNNPAYQSPFPE